MGTTLDQPNVWERSEPATGAPSLGPGRSPRRWPGTARRVPRLAVDAREAADALGMSLRHFERYVQPQIRVVYSGRLRLVPVSELQRWLDGQSGGRAPRVGSA